MRILLLLINAGHPRQPTVFWRVLTESVDEDDDDEIGEFSLIFDPKLNFVDEYWFIDVNSPFIIAKRGKK